MCYKELKQSITQLKRIVSKAHRVITMVVSKTFGDILRFQQNVFYNIYNK